MGMTKICPACNGGGSVEPSVGTTNIAPGKVLVAKAAPMTKISSSKLAKVGAAKSMDKKRG